MSTFALVHSPLSKTFRGAFEKAIGVEPTYLMLGQLRRLSLPSMLAALRAARGQQLYIPFESASSQRLASVLLALSGLTCSRRISTVDPNLDSQPVSRWQTARALASTVGASLKGRHGIGQCRRELSQLLRTERVVARHDGGKSVLYVKPNLWVGTQAGGSLGHVAGVVNGLDAFGYDVEFAGVDPPPMVRNLAAFHRLDPPRAFGFPYRTNLYQFQREMASSLLKIARQKQYSFIYQRMSNDNYVGVVLSRMLGIPLIMEFNSSPVWTSENWGRGSRPSTLTASAEQVCLQHAHLVVTVSDLLCGQLQDLGVERGRIAQYPNCVDPEEFNPQRFTAQQNRELRSDLGIAADAFVPLFIGTFGQWHGVEVLAKAIRELVQNDRAFLDEYRVHFLLVGDGLRMGEVQDILGGSDCRPYVTLPGLVPQDQASRYLAAADAFLSPQRDNADQSSFFGSPTKLFEYMAMGKPVIASDVGQIGQVLRHSLRTADLTPSTPSDSESRLAILTRGEDQHELQEAIRFLAVNPSWRGRLAENARREVLERYTWEKHVRCILDKFGSLEMAR